MTPPTELADLFDPWRVEPACAEAWPALDERTAHGWRGRRSGGDTRRINSINPLGPDAGDPILAAQELAPLYAQAGQAVMFRVPLFMPWADKALAEGGFASEGRTHTLARALGDAGSPVANAAVRLSARPDVPWLAARTRFAGDIDDGTTAAILSRLKVPACFATVIEDGAIASIAYVALAHGLAVVESVRTDPGARGRGHAAAGIAALLAWAARAGVRGACLQVAADNGPALALYRKLGFGRTLYDYHYRCRR